MIKVYDFEPSDSVVVSLDEAKKHLNIEADFEDDDAYIESAIQAAQDDAVNYLNRSLTGVLSLELNDFNAVELQALRDAVVDSIQYLPEGSNEYVDLPTENYTFRRRFIGDINDLAFKSVTGIQLPELAEGDAVVKVVINTSCPKAVKQGIYLRIADFYERREDRNGITTNTAALSLWRSYKTQW
ncbi:MAG: hypothetical protein BM557_09560 [Flavobacterium sp. MedPE-SWcel]|uniref:head-tail connector protein n=1 Tax=uncultured Flavobacterium sp. TaxID=165435 RepID=UPI0009204050|nr:head-tail connector protein [uncultured Flavobacterium sp.]OIQ16551.1 MAG: hypothetical protein BM557_09560 [Flavobacterium sp. MedPE-SWcel]